MVDTPQNEGREQEKGTVVETAEEFLALMRKSNPIWHEREEKEGIPEEWVFRGQRDARWQLMPSIWREKGNNYKKLIDDIYKQEVMNKKNTNKPLQKKLLASAWVHVERLLLHEFRRIGWLNAFPVQKPLFIDELHDLKQDWMFCLDLFDDEQGKVNVNMQHAQYGAEVIDPSLYDDIALAQHYSIPTRMLDWTEDPLIACYFATNEFDEGNLDKQCDLAVWAFDIREAVVFSDRLKSNDEIRSNFRVIFPDRSCNAFIRAQKGLLISVDGIFALEYFADKGTWPCFEDIVKNPVGLPNYNRKYILKKIVLPKEQIPSFKRLLRHEGITKEKLMPTLENVAEVAKDHVMKYRPNCSNVD